MSQQITTIDDIKASTRFPESYKQKLDGLEAQDLRPLALTQWVKGIFTEGKKTGVAVDDIVNHVKIYANARYYHEAQISNALLAVGVKREDRFGSGSGKGIGIGNWYSIFRKMTLEATGLDETDVIQADYSSKALTKFAEDNVREWVGRMNESDLKNNQRWLKIVLAILERGSELIDQKMKRPKIER